MPFLNISLGFKDSKIKFIERSMLKDNMKDLKDNKQITYLYLISVDSHFE
ncbi:hypothetical protein LALCM10_10049 [Dellaglioa algida]|nr:hypothetical protein LALCM10_10049 [Dellaglioa algida]